MIRWDAETGRQRPASARLEKAAPALTCASTYSETIESRREKKLFGYIGRMDLFIYLFSGKNELPYFYF